MNTLDRPVLLTFFPDSAAQSKREESYTPRALAQRIRAVSASQKSKLPWLKLARFGSTRSDKNSLRHDANVLAITGIEADYDGGKMTFDAARDVLEKQGLAAILYTSPSHTDVAPRWRVLCPTTTELPPDRRAALIGRLNGLFGGIFAGESWTLSQSYYFGSVSHNSSHRVQAIDGSPIDEHDDLDAIWQGKPGGTSDAYHSGADQAAGEEARRDAELVRCIVTGEHYHVETCALAGRYLARGMTRAAAEEVLRGLMLWHREEARDARWRDRYAAIPALVASADAKFCDGTREARRAVARLISGMMQAGAPTEEVRTAAYREAERYNLPPKVAHDIAAWLNRRGSARQGGEHA